MQGGKLKVIARGSNSELLSFSSGGQQVVLKVVSSGTKQHNHLRNQYAMLKELQHPRVVKALKFQEGLISQSNTMVRQFSEGKSVMVLEYAQEGSLLDFLKKKIERGEKRKVIAGIIEGVNYLHGKGIAHRDLKLQNILVFRENGEISVKLADFGFAAKTKKNEQNLVFKQYKGTRRGYMAPEIHICRQNPTPYNPLSSDTFALGVIIFAVMLGRLPFELAVPENKVFNLLREGKFAEFWAFHQIQLLTKGWEQNQLIGFKSLFEGMCMHEPKDRITIEEVKQSEWIQAGL